MLTRRRALALALLAFPATGAMAQPALPPMFSSADAEAVKAVIQRYFAAFSAKDYAAFDQVLAAPFIAGGRRPRVLATMDEVAQFYQAIRNPLDQADYSASRAVEIRLIPLHADSVLAHLHWQRLKKDGGLLNEGAEVLVMARTDSQWKIAGNLPGDTRHFKAGA